MLTKFGKLTERSDFFNWKMNKGKINVTILYSTNLWMQILIKYPLNLLQLFMKQNY